MKLFCIYVYIVDIKNSDLFSADINLFFWGVKHKENVGFYWALNGFYLGN
jgi:hypothetical protein